MAAGHADYAAKDATKSSQPAVRVERLTYTAILQHNHQNG